MKHRIKFKKQHKAYPEYKNSGVEWIGEIPAKWQAKKLKYLSSCLDYRRVPLNSEERGAIPGEFPYWGANGIVDYVGKYLFDDNLVLLGEDGAPFFEKNKEIAFSVSGKVWVNNHIHVLKINDKISRHCAYFLNIVGYESYIDGSTRDKLTQQDMGNIIITYPDAKEQPVVASYLDQETILLDQIIEKKKKLIELLKEKRAAVINRAVTKGLDPEVEMVDSGVKWIGKGPRNWETRKLKWICRLAYGDALAEEMRDIDGNIQVYGSNGVVGSHSVAITSGATIIVGRKGSYGKVQLSDAACFPIDTTFYIDDRYTKANIHWLYYLLLAMKLDESNQDSAVPGLSREAVYSKYVPCVPLEEQRRIASFLDKKTQEISVVSARVESSISLLQEYKTSLISHVVTGKVKIGG